MPRQPSRMGAGISNAGARPDPMIPEADPLWLS